MAALQQLIFDIVARDHASEGLSRAGQSAKDAGVNVGELSRKLTEVGRQSATARVGLLGDKESQAALDKLDAKLLGLDKRTSSPKLTLEGAAKANAEISSLSLELDKLGRKDVKPKVTLTEVTGRIAKAGALQPSGMGTLAALSPTLLPIAGQIAGAVGLITASFGAAAIGAGAFGLLAKSSLTTAGTAATAVQTAQNTYNAAIATGAKRATAYATEQKAIKLAYADMSPQQIALSKQVGELSNDWRHVQQSLAPVISGALVPWLSAAGKAMDYLKPLVSLIADLFKAWGQQLDKYFSSNSGASHIHDIVVAFGQFAAIQLADIVNFFKGVGEGVVNLSRDIAGAGVQYGALGGYLSQWGAGFASWSKSASARQDVQAFISWLHGNGRTLVSIVQDLAKFIPGIFAGASAVGSAELKVLSTFLGWLAKLPPSWGKPLTEVAGALLLLSKTGTLKLGVSIVGSAVGWVKKLLGGASVDIGGDAAAAAMRAAFASGGTAAAAEIRAALAGGGAAAGGEEAAGAAASSGGGTAGLGARFGLGGLAAAAPPLAAGAALGAGLRAGGDTLAPKGTSAGKLSNALQTSGSPLVTPSVGGLAGYIAWVSTHMQGLEHDVTSIWDLMWNNTITRTAKGFHDVAGWFDKGRHDISSVYDSIGHDIGTVWNTVWNNTIARLNRGKHDVAHGFDDLRHSTADVFDSVRHDVASAWNTTWNNTIGRLNNGISNAGKLFSGWRHDISDWFDNTRHSIASAWDTIWDSTAGRVKSGIGTAEKLFGGWWNNIGNWLSNARHGIASAWDTIWNNTVSRVSNGVSDVVGWFKKLPSRILGALFGLGHSLASFASAAFNEMLDAFKNVGGGILHWLGGFVHSIIGAVKGILHISSPSAVFYDIGANMMRGLEGGIKDNAHRAANATQGAIGGVQPTGSGATNEALMKSMAASVGWTGAQWQALFNVEMREAGFSMIARNPSGAYGMAQFINGPSEYYQYGGDPDTARGQITGMLNYIRQRYPDGPVQAWAHELAFGWYGKGLQGGIFSKPTLIGVGERGAERVDVTPLRGGHGTQGTQGGHGGVNVNFYGATIRDPADPVKLAAQTDFRIKSSWMG